MREIGSKATKIRNAQSQIDSELNSLRNQMKSEKTWQNFANNFIFNTGIDIVENKYNDNIAFFVPELFEEYNQRLFENKPVDLI